jgi:hypothetical protein
LISDVNVEIATSDALPIERIGATVSVFVACEHAASASVSRQFRVSFASVSRPVEHAITRHSVKRTVEETLVAVCCLLQDQDVAAGALGRSDLPHSKSIASPHITP